MSELKQEVERQIEAVNQHKNIISTRNTDTLTQMLGGALSPNAHPERRLYQLMLLTLKRQLDFEEKYFSAKSEVRPVNIKFDIEKKIKEEKTPQERMREKLRCAECGGKFKKDDVVIEKAIGAGYKDFYHEGCFSKKGKKDENKEGFDHLKTAHRAIDNLKIEVGSLEKENKRLQDMIIGSVESKNTCSICNKPIFGKMLSMKSGMVHPDCYWEDRFKEVADKYDKQIEKYEALTERFVKQNEKFGELKLKLKELSE